MNGVRIFVMRLLIMCRGLQYSCKGFAKLFKIIVLMNLKYSALMFLRNIAEIGNFFL